MVAVLPLVPADGRSVSLMLVPAALYAAAAVIAAFVATRTRSGAEPERTRGDRTATDRTTTDRATTD